MLCTPQGSVGAFDLTWRDCCDLDGRFVLGTWLWWCRLGPGLRASGGSQAFGRWGWQSWHGGDGPSAGCGASGMGGSSGRLGTLDLWGPTDSTPAQDRAVSALWVSAFWGSQFVRFGCSGGPMFRAALIRMARSWYAWSLRWISGAAVWVAAFSWCAWCFRSCGCWVRYRRVSASLGIVAPRVSRSAVLVLACVRGWYWCCTPALMRPRRLKLGHHG